MIICDEIILIWFFILIWRRHKRGENLTVELKRPELSEAKWLDKDGKISGNEGESVESAGGAGVHIRKGAFTMEGGEISGNTVKAFTSASGGGVHISGSSDPDLVYEVSFTMNGGTIAGNIIQGNDSSGGGGISIGGAAPKAVFKKIPATSSNTSGIIYGSDAGTNSNRVINSAGTEIAGRGHAVYVSGSSWNISDTVDASRHLDSTDGTGF
jgi:hypothetical protein